MPTQQTENVQISKPKVESSIEIPNFYPDSKSSTPLSNATSWPNNAKANFGGTGKQDISPFRLDTITSQSEIDPSEETDTEDILKYVPVNQVALNQLFLQYSTNALL